MILRRILTPGGLLMARRASVRKDATRGDNMATLRNLITRHWPVVNMAANESGERDSSDSTNNNSSNNNSNKTPKGDSPWSSFVWPVLAIAGVYTVYSSLSAVSKAIGSAGQQTTLQQFIVDLLPNLSVDRLVVLNRSTVLVFMKGSNTPSHYFTIGSVDAFERTLQQAQDQLDIPFVDRLRIVYENSIPVESATDTISSTVSNLINIGMIVSIVWLFRRRLGGLFGGGPGVGGGAGRKSSSGLGSMDIFNVGKSKARLYNSETSVKVKFRDVAGMDEAKEEIVEFVNFLKNPGQYKRLGAKIPKGAILFGPPGTGKTLLAKATAGEAGVPFLSVSGSEFVEMFVGVGSSRVRDLFAEAKELAPCIVFIDEIDAIGKARRSGPISNGNDERENTLNQLLVEMDGFDNSDAGDKQVVVLAGTNRPDVLDPALTRPGRFDRMIAIDKPDLKGRQDIFKVHLRPLKMDDDKDKIAQRLAYLTPGMAGADIANVCNEAALIAARRSATVVSLEHFEAAIERVIAGLEKRSRVLSVEERRTVAFHESGHAVAGWFLEHADPLLKVSIIPRGSAALGYAQYLPRDQYLYTTDQLLHRMVMTLSGRVAEELFFGVASTGARDDLQKVTKLAYSYVSAYGLDPVLGPLSYEGDSTPASPSDQSAAFTKPYSEETARLIDDRVRDLINRALLKARELLEEHKGDVQKLAERLLEREVLGREDIVELLGQRPFAIKHDYDKLVQK